MTDVVEEYWATVNTEDATIEVIDEMTFQGGSERLRHVFENRFRNSIEHGEPEVTLRVGHHHEEGVYVEDDGPGIPAERREAVFEPRHSSGHSGTGFGLAIVKRIVEAHGWELSVTDGTESGARFERGLARQGAAE